MIKLFETKLTSEVHGIWFKNILNPVFRSLQFWTDRPYVIASKVSDNAVTGYVFRRVKLLKAADG